MGKISILSKELINLIAAGEVVERPASVVKELLENSIDADSKRIIVEIENAGAKLIQIKDDGSGMSEEDALLALTQHATSKIASLKDLHSIKTLGFRGEALASIAEVSGETIIETKAEDSDAVKIIYKNSEAKAERSEKADRGTIISIKDLFLNIPARKKFLKSENTELRNIIAMFLQISLPYLHIHFELYHNGKLLYRLTETQSLKNRIFEVWGKEATNLYNNEIDLGVTKLTGLIGNTASGKMKNNMQFIYVNGRYIRNGLINSAITNGYDGFMHKSLKPSYFLFLDVDPKSVDVNIHPRKLEVKFEDERNLYLVVYKYIKSTLEKNSRSDLLNAFQGEREEKPFVYKPLEPKFIGSQRLNEKADNSEITYKSSTKKETVKEALTFTEALFQEVQKEDKIENEIKNVLQIFNTYIVFERENKMILVDQHAAAERITFEKLMKFYKSKAQTKPLLVPEIIEFNNTAEKEEILEKSENLSKIGFVISDFGGKAIQVNEIPEISNQKINYREMINELLNEENIRIHDDSNLYDVNKDAYLMIATLACHSSIRAGQVLSDVEMISLITKLQELDNPSTCPHGRPVYWEMSRLELEKHFNRHI